MRERIKRVLGETRGEKREKENRGEEEVRGEWDKKMETREGKEREKKREI